VKLKLTQAAETELEAIGDWIARDNPARAISFIVELREACHRIVEMPEAYPRVPRYDAQSVRRKVHGNYLIFYVATADEVTVIHIFHGTRDYDDLLF
jgi:toxin ParE1/3/4